MRTYKYEAASDNCDDIVRRKWECTKQELLYSLIIESWTAAVPYPILVFSFFMLNYLILTSTEKSSTFPLRFATGPTVFSVIVCNKVFLVSNVPFPSGTNTFVHGTLTPARVAVFSCSTFDSNPNEGYKYQ